MDLRSVPNFLANEAGKYIPELANPSFEVLKQAEELYKAYGGRLPDPPPLEPLRPSKQLESFKREFAVGMSDFLQRTQDTEATEAFKNSSWDKLQAEADQAWEAYKKHKDAKRNWRRPFEAIDYAAEKAMTSSCIEFLLELIPDGDYTSLLSGGLTLVYNAARRKKEMREKILELFDSLSERAKQTKANIKLYNRDPDLHAKSEQLYMAVLDCIRLSMTWLDSPSALQSFKAFFQQSQYAVKLEDAKATLDQKTQEFDIAVNMCFKREVREMHIGMEWLKTPIIATFALFAGFTKDFPALVSQLIHQAQQSQPPVVNFVQAPLITLQPSQAMMNTISSRQLCQYLAMEHNSVTQRGQDVALVAVSELDADITAAMKYIPHPLQREKMGMLALSPQFVTWLRGMDSAFIVAHESDTPQQSVLSTLSHLSGLMARTMRTPGMWTLAFFCGLHTAAGATMQGGKGLMRAITLQLLSTIPDERFSTPIDQAVVVQQLMMGNLDMICSVFGMVLGQLPAGMVFVLIDGAHWNGTEARSTEMRAVVRFLYQMVGRLRVARRGLVLKVLVTNPSARQRFAWEFAGLGEDLYMERQVLAGGHQGAERQVMSSAIARFPARWY